MSEHDDTAPPTDKPARVFILRVWEEGHEERRVWRASVREGTTGQKRYFATSDDVLEYLLGVVTRP